MPFQLDKVSNYGTTTPAVARTFLQGTELMNLFDLTGETKEAVQEVLWDLQRNLLRCHKLEQEVSAEIERCRRELKEQGPDVRSGGRVIRLPAVPDLEMKIESFLQSAKLAIRDCARTLGILADQNFDHRLHRVIDWSVQEYGQDSNETLALKYWESWGRPLIDLRNLIDHPKNGLGGRLLVNGFKTLQTETGWVIREPQFGAVEMFDVSPSLASIVDGIIRIGEEMLVIGLMRNRGNLPVSIVEIPEDQRDPKCPIRLLARLDIPGAPIEG